MVRVTLFPVLPGGLPHHTNRFWNTEATCLGSHTSRPSLLLGFGPGWSNRRKLKACTQMGHLSPAPKRPHSWVCRHKIWAVEMARLKTAHPHLILALAANISELNLRLPVVAPLRACHRINGASG